MNSININNSNNSYSSNMKTQKNVNIVANHYYPNSDDNQDGINNINIIFTQNRYAYPNPKSNMKVSMPEKLKKKKEIPQSLSKSFKFASALSEADISINNKRRQR